MATEKLTRILLSKSPFSEEQISQMTDAEGWRWVYTHKAPAKKKRSEICFTGFSDTEKSTASQLAVDAGFSVVGSVTAHLSILCTGPNPGPNKLEKASQQNVTILGLEQFRSLIETGEIPTKAS
jgi:BRCT domain type II-containing protein